MAVKGWGQKKESPGNPTFCASRDSGNSPLHRRIVCRWVFRDKSAPENLPMQEDHGPYSLRSHCRDGSDRQSPLGMPLGLDGCYVSRGKTTPTLHFLCRHGSHAIDAVSVPSSLMLSPIVEPSRVPDAPVAQLIMKMDGGILPAVPEMGGARLSYA